MKKILTFLILIAVALAPVSAFAATGTTTVTLGINAGALSLTAPVATSLSAITADTVDQNATGEAADWVVNDARGFKVAQQPGWSLTVTSTDFVHVDGVNGNSTIGVTNLSVTPNDLEKRNAAGSAYSAYSGDQAGLGAGGTFATTSDPKSVATAASTKGKGNWKGDLGLNLVVPADSDAVNYNATLTFTVS